MGRSAGSGDGGSAPRAERRHRRCEDATVTLNRILRHRRRRGTARPAWRPTTEFCFSPSAAPSAAGRCRGGAGDARCGSVLSPSHPRHLRCRRSARGAVRRQSLNAPWPHLGTVRRPVPRREAQVAARRVVDARHLTPRPTTCFASRTVVGRTRSTRRDGVQDLTFVRVHDDGEHLGVPPATLGGWTSRCALRCAATAPAWASCRSRPNGRLPRAGSGRARAPRVSRRIPASRSSTYIATRDRCSPSASTSGPAARGLPGQGGRAKPRRPRHRAAQCPRRSS